MPFAYAIQTSFSVAPKWLVDASIQCTAVIDTTFTIYTIFTIIHLRYLIIASSNSQPTIGSCKRGRVLFAFLVSTDLPCSLVTKQVLDPSAGKIGVLHAVQKSFKSFYNYFWVSIYLFYLENFFYFFNKMSNIKAAYGHCCQTDASARVYRLMPLNIHPASTLGAAIRWSVIMSAGASTRPYLGQVVSANTRVCTVQGLFPFWRNIKENCSVSNKVYGPFLVIFILWPYILFSNDIKTIWIICIKTPFSQRDLIWRAVGGPPNIL